MLFSPAQRDLAIRAMDEAEERTIAYYCIPPFHWQRLKYDLLTCQDHEWEPLPEAALARVQRLSQLRPSCKTACDFYRIQLNDPSILTAARREDIESDLYPFLIYILTHEMVHLVRLSTILPDEPTFHGSPDAEEGLVQKVAYRILLGAPDRKLDPILSKFCAFKPKYTPNSRFEIRDSKFEIENLESRISNLSTQIRGELGTG